MKTLYIDCGMGAAGDMLTAALIELFPDKQAIVDELNSLGIEGVKFELEKSMKCGITGSHMKVTVHGREEDYDHHHENDHHHDHHHDHEHSDHNHSSMADIEHIVRGHMHISAKIADDVMAVYQLIAEAESAAHDRPVTEIHFHEVGTMDAIADITAVCLLMDKLSPIKVIVSPIHVGSGQVKCAHGILPVPAPATAYILKGLPVYSGDIKGELCTPTGAALLKFFATEYGKMPIMKISAIGYGMGKKDFETANCVRAMLGDTEDKEETVLEISCNVDDMTAEAISFALEKVFEAGAFEAYTVPVCMKKSRPGTLIKVMCSIENRMKIVECLFRHTSTIGMREIETKRYILDRTMTTIDTSYGPVRKKIVSGYGVTRSKLEYDDVSKIARENGLSLAEVYTLDK